MKKLTTLKKHGKKWLIAGISLVTSFSTQAQNSGNQGLDESMRATLYYLNDDGSTRVADGNLTNYDDIFTDGIGDDAIKMNNFGENFGILREGTRLAIEQRKKINVKDTTFFCMWGMQARNYRLIIANKNLEHPGLLGSLVDSYLNTSRSLELNADNVIDFSVSSDPASYAIDRFKVIFINPTLLPAPMSFSAFEAVTQGQGVHLQWTVESEHDIANYQVEHANDGINFNSIQTVTAISSGGSRSYNADDLASRRGDNYYRIKSTSRTGDVQYTAIKKIVIGTPATEMLIYPNPVVDKRLNILFPVQMGGKYSFVLYASNGVVQPLGSLQVPAGQNIQTLLLPRGTATGIYRLRIISPDNKVIIKTINVL